MSVQNTILPVILKVLEPYQKSKYAPLKVMKKVSTLKIV